MTNLNDNGEEERALHIDTTLGTHLILVVSPLDTFSHLKQKILLEHPKCFPDFGNIEVNALKVKRKGIYYHVLESMLVKVAFRGVSTNWFLSVDASRKLASDQTPIDGHVVNPAMLIEPPTTLVDSSKLLMNNCHSDDLLGTNSCRTENKSHTELQKISAISRVHDECKSHSLQPGSSSAKKSKKRKSRHNDDVNTCIDIENTRKAEDGVPVENSALLQKGAGSHIDHKTGGAGHIILGTNSCRTENKSHTELQKISAISQVHDECKSHSLQPGSSSDKKSRKRKSRHNDDVNTRIDIENTRKVEDGVPVENSALLQKGAGSHIDHKTGGAGDVESLGRHGRVETADFDDHGKTFPVGREESVAVESHLKSVGNDANIQNSLVKKQRKVANDNARENPLLDTRFSDPNRLTSEPENIINKNDGGGGVKKSGLDCLNEWLYQPPKTSEVSQKRKGKNHVAHEPMNLDIEEKEKQKNASIVADGVSKVETVPMSLHLEDTGNKLVVDARKGSFQLDGASANPLEHFNNEKGSDNVGLTSESQSMKTKKAKKVVVGGSDPTASSKVTDIPKDAVSLSKNENKIDGSDQDKTKVNGPETTVHEPLTSTRRQIEEESDPLKSLKAKSIEESENTSKKRKSRKSKRSETEKSKIYSTESHHDVGNDIPTSGSAEDNVDGSHPTSRMVSDISKLGVSFAENENSIEQDYTKVSGPEKMVEERLTEEKENYGKKKKSRKSKRSDDNSNKHCSTNEMEDASGADKEKPVNEIVEVGNVVKEKKKKKGKKSSAEKAEFSIDENNKLEVTDICQTNVIRDAKSATMSSQKEADDVQEVGVQSLQPSKIEKPGEDVQVENDEIIKRVCEDLTDLPKDHLEHPAEEVLGEKMGDPQFNGDLSLDRNIDATQRPRGKDCHEEKIPSAEISTEGAAEVRKLKKPHSTKKAKTHNITSSVDTSAVGSAKLKNADQLEDGVQTSKEGREIGTESLHPSQIIKPKEIMEIRNDFTESAQGKETNVKKAPGLFAEKHLVEEMSEMVPNSKPALGDLSENTVDNARKLEGEVSVGKKLREEFKDISMPEVSADVSNSKKPKKSKGKAKKLDFPSSVDTSSNGPDLTKSQTHKGTERTPNNGPELSMSHKPQSSAKHPMISKQEPETQVHNPLNSVSKMARKEVVEVVSMPDGGKLSGSSSLSSGSSFRIKNRKEKEKPNINVSSKRSTYNKIGVVDPATKRKGLLVSPGAIFDDKSDATSDEGETYGSGSSTRTPPDYVSSSDYSEDESRGVVVTSQHDSLKDGEKTTHSKMSDLEGLDLGSVFRRSSRFKEAKVIASQMEETESPPVEFVPDSQAY